MPAPSPEQALRPAGTRGGQLPNEAHMTALAHAMALIRRWEGCRLVAYKCPAGIWTIGWGSTGPGITEGVRWTQAQADERLARDVEKFMVGVRKLLRRPVTEAQLGAMTSLAYNIGIGAFGSSTLLRLFNAGQTDLAAAQFAVWRRAGGKVLQGLVNRRADERRVFEGGA